MDRFLALTAGLSLSQAAALWDVSPTYVSKLRDGVRPERMQAGTRKALIEAIARLEAEQGTAAAVREGSVSYGDAYGAGYAAAVLESIEADARHILEKAAAARARIMSAGYVRAGYDAATAEALTAERLHEPGAGRFPPEPVHPPTRSGRRGSATPGAGDEDDGGTTETARPKRSRRAAG